MKLPELVVKEKLSGVYGVMRKLQAEHNEFETACQGAGNCCKVGLVIPLAECYYIAKGLRENYWKIAEMDGKARAETWWTDIMYRLTNAMYDDSWDPDTNEVAGHCAFYTTKNPGQDHSHGICEIYDIRPLVCRAYGVIAPVQEGACPRKRLPDGGHEIIRNETVDNLLDEFDSAIKYWGEKFEGMDFSIYMPAGVLRFLLPQEELQGLIERTDEKFWMGHQGYKHMLRDIGETKEVPVTIGGS